MAISKQRSIPATIASSLADVYDANIATPNQNSVADIILNNDFPTIVINLTTVGAALTDFALLAQVDKDVATWHTLISGSTWGTVSGILKKYVGALNTLADGSSAFAYVDVGPVYAIKFQQKIASGVRSTGTLSLVTSVPVAAETVTIGSTVYTWVAAPTTTANEVKIGASMAISCDNLVAAITGAAGSGSLYGSATVAHTQVTAVRSSNTVVVTALTSVSATIGNAIATTETMTNGSFGAATLGSGVTAAVTVNVDAHR